MKARMNRNVRIRREFSNMSMYKNHCPCCDEEHVEERTIEPNFWLRDTDDETEYGMICYDCVKNLDTDLGRLLDYALKSIHDKDEEMEEK